MKESKPLQLLIVGIDINLLSEVVTGISSQEILFN